MADAIVHVVVSHLASIIGLVMGAAMIAVIVVQRRAVGTTFAWLLAIVLVPYIGVPLYLLIGGRKQRTKPKAGLYQMQQVAPPERGTLAGMLCVSGAPPPRGENTVELLATGEQAFAAVLEAVRGAQQSVHVSTLIIGDDEVGAAIIAALEARARAGVEVRLLLDGFFKFRANRRALAQLAAAGGKIAWFSPVWHLPFRQRTNLRLHRKIIVTDGAAAIVGGMNLAIEYMGPAPLASRWRDLSLRVTGPAVADIAVVFRSDWAFASREPLSETAGAPVHGSSQLQVVGSGPDVANDLIYDALLSLVFEARQRLWIATPYFVPDDAIARGLVLAVRRGVDVRICVPARSNHLSADLAGASYLREIAAAGGKICCYQPGMLHAKSVLVDDRIAVVGSANLDMRSLFLDYEISLFLSSPADLAALEHWFSSLWPACGALRPAGRTRIVVESVARLFGPLT